MNLRRCYVFVLLGLLAQFTEPSIAAEAATADRAMVATVHPLATDAGVAAVKRGGSAIDAAVAAALTLGVVDGHNSGIGGGCFILMRLADGQLIAIDGRETAPAAATRDMYLRAGKPQPELSRIGPLAVAVPGALAAYAHVQQKYGRLALSDLLLPAADIAEQGFAIDKVYAGKLQATAPLLARFAGSKAVLFKPDGEPYTKGEVLRQPDLARTYRAIAKHGTDWFYRGPFAAAVGTWMGKHGGILTAKDFAAYQARTRQPLVTTYRRFTIVGFPPPSSGGVHVAQILNILESFDLKQLDSDNPAGRIHVMAEAMKLAFADRAHWLGDPQFADVPKGLIDKAYAAKLAKRIDPERSTMVPGHGKPPRFDSDVFDKHTTHIAAADAKGNWVAITATVNTAFGSKVIVPGTGVVLNNEMDDFSIQPGVPNAFGLIGAEANAVAPGKRPLSSMSPTIVLEDGEPVMTVGAAGGPKIITETLLALLNYLELQMPLAKAVAAGRFHHQWSPDLLFVEASLPAEQIAELQRRGHRVKPTRSVGITQAIARSPDGKRLVGVHDPRIPGKAAGW